MIKKIAATLPGQFHKPGPGRQRINEFALRYRSQEIAQWEALDLDALEKLAKI